MFIDKQKLGIRPLSPTSCSLGDPKESIQDWWLCTLLLYGTQEGDSLPLLTMPPPLSPSTSCNSNPSFPCSWDRKDHIRLGINLSLLASFIPSSWHPFILQLEWCPTFLNVSDSKQRIYFSFPVFCNNRFGSSEPNSNHLFLSLKNHLQEWSSPSLGIPAFGIQNWNFFEISLVVWTRPYCADSPVAALALQCCNGREAKGQGAALYLLPQDAFIPALGALGLFAA